MVFQAQFNRSRKRICFIRHHHPEMTLQQIGDLVSLTRERVRQILVSENLETRSTKQIESINRPNYFCRVCKNEIINNTKSKRFYCDVCIHNGAGKIDKGLRRRRVLRIDVPCDYCQILVTILETAYKRRQQYKNFYCSRSCRSKNLWANKVVINVNGRIQRKELDESENDTDKKDS